MQASKEAKALAAANSSKGKKKVRNSTTYTNVTVFAVVLIYNSLPNTVLQKWSKGKMKEKVNNQVLFDQVSLSQA